MNLDRRLRAARIGDLYNEHGYARDEHSGRGDGYEHPTQLGAGLALHEFLVPCNNQDRDCSAGCAAGHAQ